jgi:DNA-binding NtrC family response regulator
VEYSIATITRYSTSLRNALRTEEMNTTLSLLVVDDNLSMAESLRDVLELKGFIAYGVNSGIDALTTLREHPVNVMLTDVIMPEMDGVALYRAAKKIYPKLTTILMTAYSADVLIQQGMKEGIKTVLNKPVDMELLVSLISAYKRIASKDH